MVKAVAEDREVKTMRVYELHRRKVGSRGGVPYYVPKTDEKILLNASTNTILRFHDVPPKSDFGVYLKSIGTPLRLVFEWTPHPSRKVPNAFLVGLAGYFLEKKPSRFLHETVHVRELNTSKELEMARKYIESRPKHFGKWEIIYPNPATLRD